MYVCVCLNGDFVKPSNPYKSSQNIETNSISSWWTASEVVMVSHNDAGYGEDVNGGGNNSHRQTHHKP